MEEASVKKRNRPLERERDIDRDRWIVRGGGGLYIRIDIAQDTRL